MKGKGKEGFKEYFGGCNYVLATKVLIKQFGGKVIPTKMASLLDSYIHNPCFDTAINLLKDYPDLAVFFVESKAGGFFDRYSDNYL